LRTTKTWRSWPLFLVAALVIALDQWTKSLVRSTILLNTSQDPIAGFGKYLTFTHVRNTGAAFGMFRDTNTLFIVLPILVSAAIIAYSTRQGRQPWPLVLAFGLQVGGALGNVVDRIVLGGVTDFIDVHWWPIFNVADSSVVIGTTVLAIVALFVDDAFPEPEGEQENPDGLEPDGESV